MFPKDKYVSYNSIYSLKNLGYHKLTEEEQRRAQEGVTTSARQTSTALDDLTAAARRADETFSSGILSVPRTLGDTIARVAGDALASPVRFFEARFQTLQRLTDYGINFNYSMRSMETAVNDARMELGEFAGLVKQNSERLAMFGIGVNDGANAFLTTMAEAYRQQYRYGNDIETTLRRLGFTVEEIRETFLDYNTLMAYSRSTEVRNSAVRNQQATEYAELLDDIANLTGKRRDQISDEIVNAARQGQVQARAAQLPEEMRGQYLTFLGSMRAQFGDSIGELSEDLLGPGVGQTSTTRLMQSQMRGLSSTLLQLRRLYETPGADAREIERLENLARVQAGQSNELNQSGLAIWNRVTDAGGVMARVMTETANQQAMYAEAQARLQRRSPGVQITPEMISAEITAMQRERRAGAATTATGEGPLRDYQQFLDNQIALERAQQDVRARTINFAYDNLSTVITRSGTILSTFISDTFRPGGELDVAFNTFQGYIDDLAGGTDRVRANNAARAAQEEGYGLGAEGIRLAGELGVVREELAAASDPAAIAELEQRRDALVRQLREMGVRDLQVNAQAAAITIRDPASVRVLSQVPGSQAAEGTPGGSNNAIGTLGTIGRLFKDFGDESRVALHGIQSVQTPEQVAEVMRMSSMGTMQALSDELLSRGGSKQAMSQISSITRTNTSMLDSMLNNFRTNLRDIATRVETTPEAPDAVIREMISQLPRQLRSSFEEALSSTLRPSLDSLVTINTQQAEISDRIKRNTSGISRDYMRGA